MAHAPGGGLILKGEPPPRTTVRNASTVARLVESPLQNSFKLENAIWGAPLETTSADIEAVMKILQYANSPRSPFVS